MTEEFEPIVQRYQCKRGASGLIFYMGVIFEDSSYANVHGSLNIWLNYVHFGSFRDGLAVKTFEGVFDMPVNQIGNDTALFHRLETTCLNCFIAMPPMHLVIF
mmetsp:Transcript_16525/g.24389  ORF Transcript_16525/g.24389 Transcript_16525/m.24389 type:complete len:103 (-) Transcript_16525:148-456(-)